MRSDFFKTIKIYSFFICLSLGIRFLFIFILDKNLFYQPELWPDLVKATGLGLRFDLSALSYFFILFLGLDFFLKKKNSIWILKLFLFIWIFLNIIDIGYYSYFSDRFNVLIFGFFEDETWALVKILWKNYNVIGILSFLGFVFVGVHFILNQIFKSETDLPIQIRLKNLSLNFSLRFKLFIFPLILLIARGGWGLFPLGAGDTVISQNSFINTYAFGSLHSIFRASKLKAIQKKIGADLWNANLKFYGYENQSKQALIDFQSLSDHIMIQPSDQILPDQFEPQQKSKKLSLFKEKPHIIFVVMESWATFGFLESNKNFNVIGQFQKSMNHKLFKWAIQSSTQATVGSLSSFLAGIPQRAISAFLTENEYLQTQFRTSPALFFKNQGYKTRFIYGGNPGWRDINKFAKSQGFDSIEGEVDINNYFSKKNIQSLGHHDWGIFDDDLFKYIELTLDDSDQKISLQSETQFQLTNELKPELIVVMTTTNHPPFEWPKSADRLVDQLDIPKSPNLKNYYDLELSLKRFKAFLYSNESLQNFIEKIDASNQNSMNRNRLVAATGDHSFILRKLDDHEPLIKYSVPFFINLDRSKISDELLENFNKSASSHIDIWPTLFDLVFSETYFLSFGRSMLSNHQQSFAFNPENQIFNSEQAVFIKNKDVFKTQPMNFTKSLPYLTDLSDLSEQNSAVSSGQNLAESLKKADSEKLFKRYKSLMAVLDLYYKSHLKTQNKNPTKNNSK